MRFVFFLSQNSIDPVGNQQLLGPEECALRTVQRGRRALLQTKTAKCHYSDWLSSETSAEKHFY